MRLKIGDPFVFGRGGEEVLEFRRLGFEPKVIPGISSALAGPLAAGIPVTHRGVANRVVFMTGNGKDDSTPDVAPFHPVTPALVYPASPRTGTEGVCSGEDCAVAGAAVRGGVTEA